MSTLVSGSPSVPMIECAMFWFCSTIALLAAITIIWIIYELLHSQYLCEHCGGEWDITRDRCRSLCGDNYCPQCGAPWDTENNRCAAQCDRFERVEYDEAI